MNKSRNNKTDEDPEEEKGSSHIKIEYSFEEIREESHELDFSESLNSSISSDEDDDDSNENVNKIPVKLSNTEILRRLNQKPYFDAIVHMLKITEFNAPIEKIRCIANVSRLIVKSINRFWKGLRIKKDKLTIDGDTLLMIYIFINAKAKILDMFA
jgi:hypothetical protein